MLQTMPAESDVFQEDFALGWRVAYLYYLPTVAEPAADAGSALPDERSLKVGRRARLLFAQIKGGVEKIGHETGWPQGHKPDLGHLESVVAELSPDSPIGSEQTDAMQHCLMELNAQLLDALTVVDFRRGKAFGVGTQLAQTVLIPAARGLDDEAMVSKLRAAFEKDRINRLRGDLKDLKTLLPKYVADAVSASLSDWGKWVRPNAEKQWRFTELR